MGNTTEGREEEQLRGALGHARNTGRAGGPLFRSCEEGKEGQYGSL